MRAEAPARFGKPEIFNTDQGSQFTSAAFTGRLATGRDQDLHGRARTMGGNVFIERLWRSLKDEDVDLKGYADGREARAGIGTWIAFDNRRHAPGAVIAKGRTTHDAIKRRAFVNWSFNEKVALATGAASGIGLAAARAFAEVGAAVALADVQENAVRSAAEELVLAGPRRSQPPFSGLAAPAQASIRSRTRRGWRLHRTLRRKLRQRASSVFPGTRSSLQESTGRDWRWPNE